MHPRRLISTSVVRFVESVISKLATSEISSFFLVYVAERTGLSLTLSVTMKTGFVGTRPISNCADAREADLYDTVHITISIHLTKVHEISTEYTSQFLLSEYIVVILVNI